MKTRAVMAALFATVVAMSAQQQSVPPPSSTRPPENNEQGLRPLTAEEIPPNLNFYAMDPLYVAGTALGWSPTRVRETLDRGVAAVEGAAPGSAHVSWRLLSTDPSNVRFNVYRRANGFETKLTPLPVRATTDLIDARVPAASDLAMARGRGRERARGGSPRRRYLERSRGARLSSDEASRRRAQRRPRWRRRSQRRRRL